MIFVATGSQKFQFDRLLKEVDKLIEQKIINEDVFAQTGYSIYKPKNYSYKDFLPSDILEEKIKKSSLVITHGGTGIIINALKNGKKVIGVPRLAEYNEHVDNHQIQLLHEFKENGYIEVCKDIKNLSDSIDYVRKHRFNTYKSHRENIIKSIIEFIEE